MGRTRPKTCPDCFQPVSSSCVICICGGSISSNRTNSSTAKQVGQLKRRRTERTKREKPNFYNALDYDKQPPKGERKRGRPKTVKPVESPQKMPSPPPPHRMHLNVNKKVQDITEDIEVKEEELEEIVLSEEKIIRFSLILDDINKKICASSWQAFV